MARLPIVRPQKNGRHKQPGQRAALQLEKRSFVVAAASFKVSMTELRDKVSLRCVWGNGSFRSNAACYGLPKTVYIALSAGIPVLLVDSVSCCKG
ncbi:hypothetical protein [Shimia sagamensis]|uniref:Uncharacterized protein n=1 Tax=Shimia sagamensis TaxID=1566352 RepID=A0ABY1NLK2_9RHOB|nr:hypothetical protein [Shimia sagamensis]SMP11974.1 hypothetical protein SAMN06265373_102301 [Shimia sagamensis]